MSQYKQYLKVEAVFDCEGHMRPTAVIWSDGIKYSIDRINDIRRVASMKSGGIGIRYTCVISGVVRYLFFESGKWFTERKY